MTPSPTEVTTWATTHFDAACPHVDALGMQDTTACRNGVKKSRDVVTLDGVVLPKQNFRVRVAPTSKETGPPVVVFVSFTCVGDTYDPTVVPNGIDVPFV